MDEQMFFMLRPGDAWVDAAIDELSGLDTASIARWKDLLECCNECKPRPNKAWTTRAANLAARIGSDEYGDRVGRWMAAVGRAPKAFNHERPRLHGMAKCNIQVLRGLMFVASHLGACNAAAFAQAVIGGYRKAPGHGPVSVSIAQAALSILGAMRGEESLAELARLREVIRQPGVRRGIQRRLLAIAAERGTTVEEIEDLAAPKFDLQADGTRQDRVGEWTAMIGIDGTGKPFLRFRNAKGRTTAGVPTALKRDHAELTSLLRTQLKQMEAAITAQKARFERLMVARREWTLESWSRLIINHPIVRTIAHRVVWEAGAAHHFESFMWADGTLRDRLGREVRANGPDVRLRLWHPFQRPIDEVEEWTARIAESGLSQPFKQVHREVYQLSDMERETGTYSNRFAAHILVQSQMRALAAARGWLAPLIGGWDNFRGGPRLRLDADDLEVHWEVAPMFGSDSAPPTAGSPYVSTGEVRFLRNGVAIALEQVPPMIFSEAMRDVDLFVGVASIAGDPDWADRHDRNDFRQYWYSSTFSELTASAESRRGILKQIVPRLAIADRCSFDGRFLCVRGTRARYRIHLGSAIVVADPGARVMCFPRRVAVPVKVERPHFPYEGDQRLDRILMIAHLLAHDDQIEEASILSQIKSVKIP